jgi:hypothetical protein
MAVIIGQAWRAGGGRILAKTRASSNERPRLLLYPHRPPLKPDRVEARLVVDEAADPARNSIGGSGGERRRVRTRRLSFWKRQPDGDEYVAYRVLPASLRELT